MDNFSGFEMTVNL